VKLLAAIDRHCEQLRNSVSPLLQKLLAVTPGPDKLLAVERKGPPAMTRTVAYLRVSTEKQADKGASLETQRAKIRAYAELYDLDLVCIVEDAGASAKSLNRDGLNTVLGMLDRGEADAVLVAKLDRLTRSVRDLGTLVETYFGRTDGPALMSVAEHVDTRTAAGRLVLNVLASVSQWERETIGERTSAVMRHMRDQNRYTGGRVPYGWRLTDDGELVEDRGEQLVIAAVREYRAAGLSLRATAARLADRGLMPRSGRKWNAQTIKRLECARVA